MKDQLFVRTALGLGMLVAAAQAQALTFNEAQGTSFEQMLLVTPVTTNKLLLQVSGLTNQFSQLSFSFVDVPGLAVTASRVASNPNSLQASFNDLRNNSFSLTGGRAYQVKVSGQTKSNISGGYATVGVTALNATVSAIPEPETYAMLLAGLGLVGTAARRRKQAGK